MGGPQGPGKTTSGLEGRQEETSEDGGWGGQFALKCESDV